MTQIFDKEKIERYLFAEMSEDEQQAFEEKFLLDDELFYEVSNLENELVDLYAKNKLDDAELIRFERSLEKLPARRQKIANAVALQSFIADERTAEKPIAAAENQSFWQKLTEFFTIKTSVYGYAMSGFLILFALASVILFVQNGRKNQELARLQTERQYYEQSAQQQQELQNQIANLRQRESELQNRIDTERETSGDLTDELRSEREERKKLERSVEKLKQASNIKPSTEPPPIAPTIATVLLKSGSRINTDEQMLDVAPTTKLVSVQISLPAETGLDERFSVKLNEKIIAQNLKARIASNGQKNLQLTISPIDLIDGENKLTVINAAGAEVGKYDLETVKK